jgi:ADP-ribose pyrophosphatase
MKKSNAYSRSKQDVEILAEELCYQGYLQVKRYQLRHRLFVGGWSQTISREFFTRNRVAAALPYDPHLDQIVLIEQFRVGALEQDNPWLLEIVAGVAETGETTEAMIERELKEESGMLASEMIKIYEYWVSPGASSEHLTLYCAKIAASSAGGIHGLAEEHEDILVHVMDSAEAFTLLQTGKINNAATIIALQWLQLNRDQLRSRWLVAKN